MHANADSLQRFLLEEANVRGEIAKLTESYQTIMHQRPYPPAVKRLLGESLVAACLLTDTLKFAGSLSIQFQSDDRLALILVQCDNKLNLRALAKYKQDLIDDDYLAAFLQGQMVLTLQADARVKNYQSKLPVDSTSIAENIMQYFAQSEQISTYIKFAISEESAAGFLLQLLPRDKNQQQKENFWEYALRIGETLSAEELLSLANEELLYRLYHETTVRVFDPKAIKFQCRCTIEKMRNVLLTIGEKECKQILSTHKTIEVLCDFCNTKYEFDSIDVATIF
ncbi:MAG: heat-shock protein [Legionellales bacterium RIFCSPHIGHO2_12_FULL_37_14]|nr:MAG: heat-shock protein [Legionellales bacterium RIFCSPHIGHO2_12_FULL_37_14]